MTEFAARPPTDIEDTRTHIQKLIDRDRGRSRMSVRGVIQSLRSIIQPSTGSRQPINPHQFIRK